MKIDAIQVALLYDVTNVSHPVSKLGSKLIPYNFKSILCIVFETLIQKAKNMKHFLSIMHLTLSTGQVGIKSALWLHSKNPSLKILNFF